MFSAYAVISKVTPTLSSYHIKSKYKHLPRLTLYNKMQVSTIVPALKYLWDDCDGGIINDKSMRKYLSIAHINYTCNPAYKPDVLCTANIGLFWMCKSSHDGTLRFEIVREEIIVLK